MKKISQIFIISLSTLAFAQTNFKIEINAPQFEKDSLYLAPPMSMVNIFSLYHLNVDENKNVAFRKNMNTTTIRIKPENNISGTIDYPQPFAISYYDAAINGGYSSKIFFVEKGSQKIQIKNKDLDYALESASSTNAEYKKLKDNLKTADEKLKPFQENNPEDIKNKQKLLQTYIRKNPNSYAAFWEIVNDFSIHGFNKIYLESLALFSNKLKSIHSYKELDKMLMLENLTAAGGNFPDMQLNSTDSITKTDFSNYKLTLIDYWSSTCQPCIKDLPNLVKLREKYKDKGVNFISIADDLTKERMEHADKILLQNNISWKNYFDLNKEFPKKLNASVVPLQILVDNTGKIISRKMGELNQIEAAIEQYLK